MVERDHRAFRRCSRFFSPSLRESRVAFCVNTLIPASHSAQDRVPYPGNRNARSRRSSHPPQRRRTRTMDFEHSPRALELQGRLSAFILPGIYYPVEALYHKQIETGHSLPPAADPRRAETSRPRRRALEPVPAEQSWRRHRQPGLRAAGRGHGSSRGRPRCSTARRPTPATWRCCQRYGTPSRGRGGCEPLLAGEIRSAFAMTEPEVASSDATNIQCRIRRDGDEYVIERPQVVDLGRGRPALQDPDRDGQDRPGRGPRHASSRWCWCPATHRA